MEDIKIAPIRNGTVIDHIKEGQALNVLKILGINENTVGSTISLAMHVCTKKDPSGWKDIVKIEDKELDFEIADKISLIAPNATIDIIRDYYVAKKHTVRIEDHIKGLINCSNPNCITNVGEPVEPEFDVVSHDPPILRCAYCERYMTNISENLL